MTFLSPYHGKAGLVAGVLLLAVGVGRVPAQTDNLSTPGATARAATLSPPADPSSTNVPVAQPTTESALSDASNTPAAFMPSAVTSSPQASPTPPLAHISRTPVPRLATWRDESATWPAQLLALAGVVGFMAYYCGLTRAKNCGHTCTALLAGAMFGLAGFWISGFAVQSGGLGDAHAALMGRFAPTAIGGLDHELGLMMGGHPWGFMGSAGFFLSADNNSRDGMALLFMGQAILLALTVTVALGGALERARLLALVISAFLIGALIDPLIANWVWGGGWLAELGREFGLGHGMVDVAGAGVIHLAAGTLALVFTLELGPRYGRFGRNHAVTPLAGHNIPFVILGSGVIVLALTAVNGLAELGGSDERTSSAFSATNTLLAAAGGLLASFFYALHRTRQADPHLLCRGLIGGAVAVSAGSALVETWAAFLIGVIAAALVQFTVELLERRRIDDPVGAVAVHGTGGAWGLIAVGIFADGSSGTGLNGVAGPVRGLFDHDGLQLVAQIIGGVVFFAVVFGLGWICVMLIQKIVGIRVDVADETSGLDLPTLGVLGYQADGEVEKER